MGFRVSGLGVACVLLVGASVNLAMCTHACSSRVPSPAISGQLWQVIIIVIIMIIIIVIIIIVIIMIIIIVIIFIVIIH